MSLSQDVIQEAIIFFQQDAQERPGEDLANEYSIGHLANLYTNRRGHMLHVLYDLVRTIVEPEDNEMIISRAEYDQMLDVHRSWKRLRAEGVISDDDAKRTRTWKENDDE